MKVAIILNGNIRTWSDTKESFKKTFGPLNADCYLSTYDIQYGYHPYIQGVIGDSTDQQLSDEEVCSQFMDINLIYSSVENAKETSNINEAASKTFHSSMRGSMSSYAQYRKFLVGLFLMNNIELRTECKYDVVIKTRCDLVYEDFDIKELVESVASNKIVIVDKGNVFPNDCIFIGSRDSMFKMGQFMYDEFYNPVYANSNQDAPHGLLRNAINHVECGVLSRPLINHVLRKDGKVQYY